MTRDEAVAFIKFNLGNRTGSELDNAIVDRLKQAQRLLEQGRSLPYFLKEEDVTLPVPAGSGDVSFPAGFLREVPDETFHYRPTSSDEIVYLGKMNPREGNRAFLAISEEIGRPLSYAILKTEFRFFPVRDQAYTLTYSYYKSAGSLDSNVSDNAWLVNAPDILIGRAGALIAEIIAHERAKAAFDQMFMIAWNSAFAEGVLREQENDPLRMGAKL